MSKVRWWMVLGVLVGWPIGATGAEHPFVPPQSLPIQQIPGGGLFVSGGIVGGGGSAIGGGGSGAGGMAGGWSGAPFVPAGAFSEALPKPSEYWLGVECTPVDPTLRSQLQLPEGQGLVVRSVVSDSPAAKAGLREHDILLQAGEKKLHRINDLIEAVEAAKEQKLSLEMVREGKRQKIDVTPAKRPAEQMTPGFGGGMAIPAPGNPDFETFRKWFEKMQPGQPLRFRFFQPGFVVPPGFGWQFGWGGTLPEGLSIAITKSGKEPARISVKKDGQTWEVTEKELDKLPPDIRPHVERMLGQGGPVDMDFPGEVAPPWFGGEPKDRLPSRIRSDLQKQLEKQQQQLEKLQKQLEELKNSLDKFGPEPKEQKKPSPKQPDKEPVKEKV